MRTSCTTSRTTLKNGALCSPGASVGSQGQTPKAGLVKGLEATADRRRSRRPLTRGAGESRAAAETVTRHQTTLELLKKGSPRSFHGLPKKGKQGGKPHYRRGDPSSARGRKGGERHAPGATCFSSCSSIDFHIIDFSLSTDRASSAIDCIACAKFVYWRF